MLFRSPSDAGRLGPSLEVHRLFPQRTNVEFVEPRPEGGLRVAVWERGVGLTLACGTGACAAAVIGMRRGDLDSRVRVSLPGGQLLIEWPDQNAAVWMTGPTQFVFEGEWHDD